MYTKKLNTTSLTTTIFDLSSIVYSASEIPEYRLPWKAVRWEIEQMMEHGRGRVRLEYGRRLYSPKAAGGRPGDFTLKASKLLLLTLYFNCTFKYVV